MVEPEQGNGEWEISRSWGEIGAWGLTTVCSALSYHLAATAGRGPEPGGAADVYLGAEEYAGEDHQVRESETAGVEEVRYADLCIASWRIRKHCYPCRSSTIHWSGLCRWSNSTSVDGTSSHRKRHESDVDGLKLTCVLGASRNRSIPSWAKPSLAIGNFQTTTRGTIFPSKPRTTPRSLAISTWLPSIISASTAP